MAETAALEQLLEFRCNRCWNSNCVSCELSGSNVECTHCGAGVTVPEVTPERIARGAEMAASNTVAPKPREKTHEEMTAAERREFERNETRVSYSETGFNNVLMASRWARLAAQIVDVIAAVVVLGIGAAIVTTATRSGLVKVQPEATLRANYAAYALLFFPSLVFLAVQWNLVATRGQTIGKMLLFIRIIDSQGNSPGFVRGVILRDWLRSLLSVIPFFWLIDAAMIFTDSRRCLHDYLAGTRVVPTV